MPFFLKRDGENIPLEVQRWQYFLLRAGIAQTGRIDGQFGRKTEDATKFFQVQHELPTSGQLDTATLAAARPLGYSVLDDLHYEQLGSAQFPPRPQDLRSPSNAARNAALACYKFKQLPRARRADPDEIVILDSCDGSLANWRNSQIVTITIPQKVFASGFSGTITCHRAVAPHVKALFVRWEELDLLHLIRTFEGDFSPRYKRGQSPGDEGHGVKRSNQVSELSNHAFGSAFDINEPDNTFGGQPAAMPLRGCVRELVASANALGFFWGGHFNSPKDGMHFEFADFDNL